MNVTNLPEHEKSRLILKPTDRRVESNFASTDSITALTRGVAEYVMQLEIDAPGGRSIRFSAAFDAWAEPEDTVTEYPRFAAYTNDQEGTYDWASMNRIVSGNRFPDGTWLVTGAEMNVPLYAEIWATDPEERQTLCRMLEQAFNPVDWMQGFRLELPHYYNQRATYELTGITYLGGAQEAQQRFVKARMALKASVPVTQLMPFKLPKISVLVDIDGVADTKIL